MRVYISGPLQGSTDLRLARALYEAVAEIVTTLDLDPYVPHMHTDPERAQFVSASEVYRRDVRELLNSDLVIAHVGAPSTGVGAELAIAAHAGVPIVAIVRSGEKVSRFAAGLIEDAGGTIVQFGGIADLKDALSRNLMNTRARSVVPSHSRLVG
ncbi:nucleoside 2-deoxyribosyltransferase [Blastococcus aurantiacus]|uniref:nucleoside 2-deoxyribosyltransferase n=1 Tax=Blastococcus aurantiacus TaxID=1550231 RepID=UPI00115FA48C|nr:nucleoside 2-deoxyribosyltransferase [Blastococcus aurantiacus]